MNRSQDSSILANPNVMAFARMEPKAQLLHLELRHGATGFRNFAEWSAWHEAAHAAELDHEHGAWESEACDSAGQGITPEVVFPAQSASLHQRAEHQVRALLPTPEQKAAAWSADIMNPRFRDNSRGTTVIFDWQDQQEEI